MEDLNAQSKQLSASVRTAALSLLAVSWGLLIGTDKISFPLTTTVRHGLARVGALVIITLIVDLLQYIAGYLNSLRALRRAESLGASQVTFNTKAPLYVLRTLFFWVKILAVPAIGAYFLTVIAPLVQGSAPPR